MKDWDTIGTDVTACACVYLMYVQPAMQANAEIDSKP